MSSPVTEGLPGQAEAGRQLNRLDFMVKAKISETKNKSGPLLACELCDFECISEEMRKQHHSSVHEVNLDVQQLNFKCDLCDYESKSRKGVKIHRRAKHKSVEPLPTNTSSSPPSSQTNKLHLERRWLPKLFKILF